MGIPSIGNKMMRQGNPHGERMGPALTEVPFSFFFFLSSFTHFCLKSFILQFSYTFEEIIV
jgi:hypothetical protein